MRDALFCWIEKSEVFCRTSTLKMYYTQLYLLATVSTHINFAVHICLSKIWTCEKRFSWGLFLNQICTLYLPINDKFDFFCWLLLHNIKCILHLHTYSVLGSIFWSITFVHLQNNWNYFANVVNSFFKA